ncbi:hypothetical protein AJ87_02795 [Rhizobium yanglingense]|nr:hypothetical protein AJ87_02795 [Rhizobium yanglingense]
MAVQTARLRDERWGFFSPETGESNHIVDLSEIWVGQPFYDGPTVRMTEDELVTAMAWLNERIFLLGAVDHTPSIDWLLERARAP